MIASACSVARLISAAMLIIALTACSPGRLFESVGLLTDIAEGAPTAAAGEAPAQWTAIANPAGSPRPADLYVPAGTPKAALVMVPGAAQEGMRDPRLIAFAGNLAKAGFVVLVPQLAGDDPLQVSAADIDAIAQAGAYLAELADVPEFGMAAVSYAVGPTILAALRPEIRDKTRFILAIGGYHDVVASITYLTTGAFRAGPDQPWRLGTADPRAKWLFLKANTHRLDPPDRDLLAALAQAKRFDPAAPVPDLEPQLGAEGAAIFRLLVNEDPERVPALIADLPAWLRDEIYALDLADRDLDPLAATMILIHGRDDPMVPFTESVRLAEAVPAGRSRLFLLDELFHVDLGSPGLNDAVRLVAATYRLLTERDRAPAPRLPESVASR